MEERQRNQIKSALLKCANENEGKGTCTGYVVVSSVCRSAEERIEELEKENAELKKESDFYHREKGEYKSAFLQEVRKTIKLNKQLTKAKELIKRFVELENCTLDYDDIKEAEQFIKE